MPAKGISPKGISAYTDLKRLTPYGDLGRRDDIPMWQTFPHPIKGSGGEWMASQLIPGKGLKYQVGAPAMVETGVAPGIGSKMPQGKKSVAWKAVIAGDETLSGEMTAKQVINVNGVTTPASTSPSKFSAKVGVHAGGNQGINTGTNNGSESHFGMANYRMSNLGGTPGPVARSTRWAARVGVHAGGNQRIKADKSTAANASVYPLRNYEMIEAAPAKKAKSGKASRKVR